MLSTPRTRARTRYAAASSSSAAVVSSMPGTGSIRIAAAEPGRMQSWSPSVVTRASAKPLTALAPRIAASTTVAASTSDDGTAGSAATAVVAADP